jgi:hypothetical protein
MSLVNAIQNVLDWRNKTSQELYTILNEVHVNPDPTPYTFVSLGDELTRRGFDGSTIRSQVAYTMMQIELKEKILPVEYEIVRGDIKAAYIAMSATKEGLSLHLPERQQLIGLLAQVGEWHAGVMDAVLSLGVYTTKLYECTEQEVIDSLAEIATIEAQAARDVQKQEWQSRFAAIMNQLDTIEHADGLTALTVLVNEITA